MFKGDVGGILRSEAFERHVKQLKQPSLDVHQGFEVYSDLFKLLKNAWVKFVNKEVGEIEKTKQVHDKTWTHAVEKLQKLSEGTLSVYNPSAKKTADAIDRPKQSYLEWLWYMVGYGQSNIAKLNQVIEEWEKKMELWKGYKTESESKILYEKLTEGIKNPGYAGEYKDISIHMTDGDKTELNPNLKHNRDWTCPLSHAVHACERSELY